MDLPYLFLIKQALNDLECLNTNVQKFSSQAMFKSFFAMHKMMSLYFPNHLLFRTLKGYHISQQEFPHDRDEQKL